MMTPGAQILRSFSLCGFSTRALAAAFRPGRSKSRIERGCTGPSTESRAKWKGSGAVHMVDGWEVAVSVPTCTPGTGVRACRRRSVRTACIAVTLAFIRVPAAAAERDTQRSATLKFGDLIACAPDCGISGLDILLSSDFAVEAFSFGIGLEDGANYFEICGLRPGSGLPSETYFWTAVVQEGAKGAIVAAVLSGPVPDTEPAEKRLLAPGDDIALVRLNLRVHEQAPAPCPTPLVKLCFTGDLGTPPVRIRLSPEGGAESFEPQSECREVPCAHSPCFKRGDADGDGKYTIGDAIQILNYLFAGAQEPTSKCLDTADVDDNGQLIINDPIWLLTHMFAGGPEPADPGPHCGPDPTPDDDYVDCEYPCSSCLCK